MVEFGRTARAEFGPSIVRQGYVIPHASFGGTMLRLMVGSIMRIVPGTPSRIF